MLYNLRCIFVSTIITIPAVVCSLKLQVDGRMVFGPKFEYEYRVRPAETSSVRTYVTSMDKNLEEKDGPKMIDIIIKNNKSNPRLVQVAEAKIYGTDVLRQGNVTETEDKRDGKKEDTNKKVVNDLRTAQNAGNIQFYKENSEEVTTGSIIDREQPSIFSEERPELARVKGATVMAKENKPKKGMKKDKKKDKKNDKGKNGKKKKKTPSSVVKDAIEIINKTMPLPMPLPIGYFSQGKNNVSKNVENITTGGNATVVEEFPHPTEMIEIPSPAPGLYVAAHYVRDDLKIKEFTKHVYEQSIRTFQHIKEKLTNYEMKKEADYLMQGYEEKFGDFVRETQTQKIRTRLGNEKVILNTLDTSNRILERLVNHLIGKMDKKGILRTAGAENVILKELEKKKELENKHVCNKMQICRSSDSLTNFIIDILTIILSADDRKVIEMRDASTEVLKNTDFSRLLDPDTERRFHKGMTDLDSYDAKLMRPIFAMIKNILASRNTPIKVVGPEDYRVNRTVAFMELINNFDKKLPPNEKNLLEWNDMRNSWKEWKEGKRKDSVELVQHLADHMLSPGTQIKDGTTFDRNMNTILGF